MNTIIFDKNIQETFYRCEYSKLKAWKTENLDQGTDWYYTVDVNGYMECLKIKGCCF